LPSASRSTCPEVVQGDIDAKTGILDPRLRQSFQATGQSLQFARDLTCGSWSAPVLDDPWELAVPQPGSDVASRCHRESCRRERSGQRGEWWMWEWRAVFAELTLGRVVRRGEDPSARRADVRREMERSPTRGILRPKEARTRAGRRTIVATQPQGSPRRGGFLLRARS